MKKNVFYSVYILGVLCMLLIGCVSTERPFTEIYAGEEELLLSGTRWELFDLKSSDNFSMIVEFHVDGTLSWYNIPDSYNGVISEKSTWERKGYDLVFNAHNSFRLYEGEINETEEDMTVVGRFKTGYARRSGIKSYPSGDFMMKRL
jgi:hypothetical protein